MFIAECFSLRDLLPLEFTATLIGIYQGRIAD